MTGREDFPTRGGQNIEAFSTRMVSGGAGVPQMLAALAFALGKLTEIVLAGPLDAAFLCGDDVAGSYRTRWWRGRVKWGSQCLAIDGKPTVYVCSNFACNLPVTELGQLDELLE